MRIETTSKLITGLLASVSALALASVALWVRVPEAGLWFVAATTLLLACACLGAALAWHLLLRRRVLRPLTQLDEQIQDCIAREAPPAVPAQAGDDEVGRIAVAVLSTLNATMRDAAERRNALAMLEAARHDAEAAREEFIAMSETLPMAIYQIESGPNGYQKFVFASRRTEAVLGVSPEEIMDSPATRWRYANPEDVAASTKHSSAMVDLMNQDGRARPFEAELRLNRDGEERWIRAYSLPIRTRADGVSLWSGYYEDITERKLAALQLQTVNEEQRAILQAATVGIVFERDDIIERSNAQMDDIFRAPPGSMIGTRTSAQHADDLPQDHGSGSTGARLRRGETVHVERRLMRHDGTVFWAQLRGRAVYPDDPSRGNLWMLEDVTERHQYLAALLQAKELAEQAAKAKSDFLANMSHEIRTPLNAVMGMAYLLQSTELTGQQLDYTRKIHDSSRHLLGIINEILDFSKIESGKFEIERAEFDLQQLLDRVTGMVAEKIRQKQLKLTVDVAPDVPGRIEGDELRLGQILLNYANNAVKFTDRGEINLSVRVQEHLGQEVQLRFSVTDTGIGLTPEQIGRLFQSFAQADASITRKHGGTGLGLAISKRLAQLMGGDVGVESQHGHGSNFWFTVRVRACAAKPGLEADATGRASLAATPPDGDARLIGRAALTGARILLVEDNELNQEVATALLREVGCIVDVTGNGELAVAQVRARPCDVVLMDMQMPVMDGVTATQLIRQIPHLRDLPIIAMTANVMRQDRERCLAAGMNDFVGKPIEPVELWRILQKWYRPGAGRQPAEAPALSGLANDATPQTPWPDDIDGLDMAQGRARVLGNDALYRSLLRRFAESHVDSAERIGQALAGAQFELAERLAHTARSVAGNIGAQTLANAAAALEQALRGHAHETVWRPLWQAYAEALRTLLDGLAPAVAALQPSMPTQGEISAVIPNVDPVQLAHTLAKLEHLLRESDPEASNWFEANATLLSHALRPEHFSGIKAALDKFDLDTALEVLMRAAPSGVALHA